MVMMKHPMVSEVVRENELDQSVRAFEVEVRPGVRCRVAVSWECDLRPPIPDEKPNWRPMTAPCNRHAAETLAHLVAGLMLHPELRCIGERGE
jgi:hypothetical protein